MRKKGFMRGCFLLGVAVLMMCVCGACASGSIDSSSGIAMETRSDMLAVVKENGFGADDYRETDGSQEEQEPEVRVESETKSQSSLERKLIKTVDMSVETKEFDEMHNGLVRQIEEAGGYVENLNTYNGSIYDGERGSRNTTMVIRIPQDQLELFLETVSSLGNVISRNDQVEDVTLTYVDLQSHKTALETEQGRLLELLEQAETVEELITVEGRLSEVRYQIESMESQLRTYDNMVNYSTVNLSIQEVVTLTPVTELTAWERIVNGFSDSVKNVINGLKEAGIWFLIHIPYLVIWALIIGIVVFLIHKGNLKKREKRKNPVQANAQQQSVVTNEKASEQDEKREP